MDAELLLLRAKSEFEKGEYGKCVDTAIEVLKSDYPHKSPAHLLAAKGFLMMFPNPTDEDTNKTLYTTIGNACATAESIEEVWQIEKDFFETFHIWKRKNFIQHLEALERNPDLKEYQKFLPFGVKYMEMSLYITVHIRNCKIVKDYQAANGLEVKDYVAQHDYSGDGFTSEEMDELKFEASKRIFAKAVSVVEECRNANFEYYKSRYSETLGAVMLAHLLCGFSYNDKTPDAIRCERMKFEASVLDYRLRTVVCPGGKTMSLDMCDNREKVLNDLKELYDKIIAIEPDFVAPSLPSAEIIGAAPKAAASTSTSTSTTSSSGGGCYVATAVYGSYDCPEVWTLRRFRDNILAKSFLGRLFIYLYYAVSPTIVKWFGETQWFKNMWKAPLDKMVAELNENGVEDTPYDDRQW